MEGPIIVFMVAYVILPIIWVYKRFFEHAGLESPELIRACSERPTLAVLRAERISAKLLAARLRDRLSKRSELVLNLGRWPWPHHVVAVEVVENGADVRIVASSCRVARQHEVKLLPLTELLLGALRESGLSGADGWLHPAGYGRVLDGDAPHGWRLLPESQERFPFEPWASTPEWVSASATAPAAQLETARTRDEGERASRFSSVNPAA